MQSSPPPWQLSLARLEGTLPFMPPDVAELLAMASLRRMWFTHMRDFPFDEVGPEHDPGLEAAELTRTWHAAERAAFLTWIVRRGHPPLAEAARFGLAARPPAEPPAPLPLATLALERLDALLPAHDPVPTLIALVEALRVDEVDFLEGDSDLRVIGGRAFTVAAPRGGAWALSLALAVRPQLFALGAAPLALAGVARRELFRSRRERPASAIVADALDEAAGWAAADLARAVRVTSRAKQIADAHYASSHAAACFRMVAGLGPLTRAELARALGVTARTVSLSTARLEELHAVMLRKEDRAVIERCIADQQPIP